MKVSRNKNIFNDFLYDRKSLTVNNVIKKFGSRIIDLYTTFPINIVQENLIEKLQIKYQNHLVTIDLKVIDYHRKYNKKSPFKVICEDNFKQKIFLLYFNLFENQIKNFLIKNQSYRISGKLEIQKNSFQIIHPNVVSSSNLENYELIYPEYDLARKKINKKIFRNILNKNFNILENYQFPYEWISNTILIREEWMSCKDSLLKIHKPSKLINKSDLELLRKRLSFDELLASYLTFYELKKKFNFYKNNIEINKFNFSQKIIERLPFNLTNDQKKVLYEIKSDLKKKFRMYRLIQGDVGSGKTIVALLAASDVIESGFQVVLMAPTEILARQHYEYFCDNLPEIKDQICLLTGKTKSKKEIYKSIRNNNTKILIGTHSVYNDEVNFKNLGLIIIDEQHKFGVKQRIKLLEKSKFCHTLIMSATPIPRSLSFVIYGEVTISDIKTKPDGRKKIVTSIINMNKLQNLIEGINRKIKNNEQVFWILPTISDETNEKETVETRYKYLKKLYNDKVSMIHGRMNKDILNKTINDFKIKKTSIIVSTTVIEVGINIPTATLIIIERAEMFGLAQLHQLRGRVSRGNLQGNCVFIHGNSLSDQTKERLLILKKTDDGFKIAEKDLEMRGAGDFFGTNQSGIPIWKFFNPSLDKKLILDAKLDSEKLVKNYEENRNKINFLRDVFYRNENFMNYFSV